MDSDAIVNHLDLPFEWLMNYWGINKYASSLPKLPAFEHAV